MAVARLDEITKLEEKPAALNNIAEQHKKDNDALSSTSSIFQSLPTPSAKMPQDRINLRDLNKAILSGIEPDILLKQIEQNPEILLERLEQKECMTIQGPSGHRASITAYRTALATEDTQLAAKLRAKLVEVAGVKEAEKQFKEQFPDGWQETESKKWAPIFAQLETVTLAIKNAAPADITSPRGSYEVKVRDGSAVATALAQFRLLLETTRNESATTGRHFNPELLLLARQICKEHYRDYFEDRSRNKFNNPHSPRVMLFWQQVIGYIQRFLPVNYTEALCDGLYKTAEKLQKNIPQGRSTEIKLLGRDMFGNWIATEAYSVAASRHCFDYAVAGVGETPNHGYCTLTNREPLYSMFADFKWLCRTKAAKLQRLIDAKPIEMPSYEPCGQPSMVSGDQLHFGPVLQ